MIQKIYIAGPMRGKKNFNFDAFDDAKERLQMVGYEVISPADIDREFGFDPAKIDIPANYDWNDLSIINFDLRDAIDRDIDAIKSCSAIYMLDGWQSSTGAKAEFALANWLGLTVLYQSEEESVLHEAARITGGDRQSSYGPPDQDFRRTAEMWSGYLHYQLKDGFRFEPFHVASMMILLKQSRQMHQRKRDNWTDTAGYAWCGSVCDRESKIDATTHTC